MKTFRISFTRRNDSSSPAPRTDEDVRMDETEFDVEDGNESELLRLFAGFLTENRYELVRVTDIEDVSDDGRDAFEAFLMERNDVIDNSAYELLSALAAKDIEWNMAQIGAVTDATEGVLAESGVEYCHPFYEGDDRTPCVKGSDCKNRACPYRLAAKQR